MVLRIFITVISSCLAGSLIAAESQVLGRTYEIVEPDALTEIQSKVAQVDWETVMSDGVARNAAAQAVSLPRAREDRIRYHIPYYTAEFDVKDQNGQIIYPKGFQFNPLEHVRLPQRLMFISKDDLAWAQDHLKSTDMVMITSGDYRDIAMALQRPVFILTPPVRDRLSLQFVPSIVTQEGSTLRIEEHSINL